MKMTEVRPFIRCVDYWPGPVPPAKMEIYRQLVKEKQISRPRLLMNQETGSVTVEYEAIAPHEWIRQQIIGRQFG